VSVGLKKNFSLEKTSAIWKVSFVDLSVKKMYNLGADSNRNFNARDRGIEKGFEIK